MIVKLPLVFAVHHQAAGSGLFPQDSDRSVQRRPSRSISGIERVVDLAGRVREAELIEPLALPGAELAEPLALLGRDQLEDGVGGRIEVILGIGAHLVGIDRDVGLPAQIGGDPGLALDLGLEKPVAVHVEEVMVEPSAGEALHVFRRHWLGIGRRTAVFPVKIDEAIAAVRVLHWVDDDNDVFEHLARCLAVIG